MDIYVGGVMNSVRVLFLDEDTSMTDLNSCQNCRVHPGEGSVIGSASLLSLTAIVSLFCGVGKRESEKSNINCSKVFSSSKKNLF